MKDVDKLLQQMEICIGKRNEKYIKMVKKAKIHMNFDDLSKVLRSILH